MPTLQLEPAPFTNPLVDPQTGEMTDPWIDWIDLRLTPRVQSSAPAIVTITSTGQGASIGTTSLVPSAPAGLYRVGVFMRVSQAATTSSSMLATITATDGAVPYAQSTPAQTGNVTTAVSEGVFMLRVEDSTPISYSTTYASVGGVPMLYTLAITVEQVV